MLVIRITEKCTHKGSLDPYTGIRAVTYKTDKTALYEAIQEYEQCCNKSQIISIEDSFKDQYCFGKIVKVEIVEETFIK